MYKKMCEGPMRNGIRLGLISGVGFGFTFSLRFLVCATSFYAGARLVQGGKTTFADVFRVFMVLAMAAIAISQSSSFAPDSKKAKSAAASIFSILDRKSKIDPSDESDMTPESVKGEIELKNVSFKYPARPDMPIFHDLSLKIQSGKRFYDTDAGQITLDGIEIHKFQVRWLRKQFGLVSQEPVLFNDTIRANIGYGRKGNATEAEIVSAAQLANAHKFISRLQQIQN